MRATLILGKRSNDPQRAAMLKRLGIAEEEAPAPAAVQREALFSYSAPRLVEPQLVTLVPDVPFAAPAANDRPPPVNTELDLLRAELAEMRQQFSALPIEAPRRRRKRVDVIKGLRLAIWFVAVAGAAFVAFAMLNTPESAVSKPDHILAAAVGQP